MLIDTHTHLYEPSLANDLVDVLRRARTAGVARYCLPNVTIQSMDLVMEMASNHPQQYFPMVGLHPAEVGYDFRHQLDQLQQWLGNPLIVAVGEVGLDFYHSKEFVEEQKQAFHIQAQWAIERQLPLVCHSRGAEEELYLLVAALKKQYPSLHGVFHSFTGTVEQAKKIVDLGFYLGVNGILTYGKKSAQLQWATELPLSCFVLETDSPWLPPTPHRGQRNEPAYLQLIAQALAECKGVSFAEVAETTTANAEGLFGLNKRPRVLSPNTGLDA